MYTCISLKTQNKVLEFSVVSVSPRKLAAVPEKSLGTQFSRQLYVFQLRCIGKISVVKCSQEFGSKQICKCKELHQMGDTTQTLGKPEYTWKQLVAQEADIIEDQSVHWEVIWGVEATNDFIANHTMIVKLLVPFAM